MAESDDADYQVLQTVNTLPEAELLVGLLTSQGIDAKWLASDAGGQLPNLDALAGVAIVVRDEDLERARELLRDAGPLTGEEDAPES